MNKKDDTFPQCPLTELWSYKGPVFTSGCIWWLPWLWWGVEWIDQGPHAWHQEELCWRTAVHSAACSEQELSACSPQAHHIIKIKGRDYDKLPNCPPPFVGPKPLSQVKLVHQKKCIPAGIASRSYVLVECASRCKKYQVWCTLTIWILFVFIITCLYWQ